MGVGRYTLSDFNGKLGFRKWWKARGWQAKFLPGKISRGCGKVRMYNGVVVAWWLVLQVHVVG